MRIWLRAQPLILAVSLLWTSHHLLVSHAQPPSKCEGLVAKMKVPSQVSIGGEGPSQAKIKALIGNKGRHTIANITLGLHLPQGLVGVKAAMHPKRASVPATFLNASIFWLHLPLLRPRERWRFKVGRVCVL